MKNIVQIWFYKPATLKEIPGEEIDIFTTSK